MNRLVSTIALSVLALALAPLGAEAAATKRVAKKETTSVVKRARVSRTYVAARHRSVVRLAPAKPSFGQLAGLHSTSDDLDLKSSVALVIDQDKNEVLLSKNDSAVLPIASITKLMTGLVISEAKLPQDEQLTITQDGTTKNCTVALPHGRPACS